MIDTHIAKLMWESYAIQAGGKTFDGKPLPTWDELGEDRQSCWIAAASVAASRIEKLEAALLWYAEHCQKGGDDIEGPYGDYGQKARKALEEKDD